MKPVMWLLVGVGGLLLLGSVVLPLVSWVLSTVFWLAIGALVIGAGIAVARSTLASGTRRRSLERRDG